MFISLWLTRSRSPVGLRYALRLLTKSTLPPLNLSLQPAALSLWLRSGSWLTPTRGDPDCHVTERSWLGKGDRVISRARSINWGAAGPASGWIRKLSRRNVFPPSTQRPVHDSRRMNGGVRSLPCRGPCGAAERVGLARASRWLGGGKRPAGSVEDSNLKPAQTPMLHPKEGPAAGGGRGPFLLLAHGLWVWFVP